MTAIQLRVFAVFALGYFVSYLFRGVNLGFAPFMTKELGLTAANLGTLTSLYFLGFAGAQIPAGVLLDHFGSRRVTSSVLLFAAVGALCYALSHNMAGLMIGRLLIGIGASVCLGGAFKATAQYFPVSQLTLVNGLVMAVGGLGGVVVGTPLTQLLTIAPWRVVGVGLALFTAGVAFIIWLGAPRSAVKPSHASVAEQFKGTLHILRSHAFWKIATFSGLTQAVFYAMQSLWVGAFLRDVVPASAAPTSTRVGALISLLGAAFIVGNIGFGALARAFERRGIRVQTFSGVTMSLFVVVQGLLAARVDISEPVLWAAYGAFGCTGILTYAVLAEYFPANLIGRATTTLTLVLFVGIFVVQNAVGAALSHWTMVGEHYPATAHQAVWAGLIALQVAAGVWYFMPGRQKATQSEPS